MSSKNIRFIDSLKVGAYQVELADYVKIDNNINNYVITATGESNKLQGESLLVFDSVNLGIGGNPSGEARLEVYHTGSVDNILLIKNTETNTGIKVDKEGIFQLLEFSTLPNAVAGGIVYSNNDFYIGTEF
jgi:hypothetical protein